VLEISFMYLFLYGLIRGDKFRVIIKFLYSLYILICTIIWVVIKKGIFITIPSLFGIENLFIIMPCLFYLYEMIKSDDIIDFKTDSNFMATCGILFYFSTTTPYFFGAYSLFKLGLYEFFSLMNTVFYMLLFISFLKAYLCPIPERKN
jgi:hypothetical protein